MTINKTPPFKASTGYEQSDKL